MHRRLIALRWFILHRWTRYVLCWLIALGLTALQFHIARHMFDNPKPGDPTTERRDGNFGHTLIDFGGQWLIANLFATGRGHELYLPAAQREVADAAFLRADEAPAAKDHDADSLIKWLMDVPPSPNGAVDSAPHQNEPAIGGPLYPPTHALLFAPLGSMPPQQSYRVAQILYLLSGWVAGLAITGISAGRIWWPVATTFVMIFPGFGPSLHLAQNSALSLAIVLIGWWLVSRGWDVAGGIVWGLLAFKPVWAAAFLLVPLLTRRWRMFLAMTATGLALVVATLPFVGITSWLHWFRIGRTAAALYNVDENWVFLSRDLLGIPRRWMLNFAEATGQRDRVAAAVAGWTIWATVLAGTAVVAWFRRRAVSGMDGIGAAFVAIGAWASCYHFIYYDSLLAVFPVALLLTRPREFLRPALFIIGPASSKFTAFYAPKCVADLPPPMRLPTGPWSTIALNSFVLTAVALLILIEQGFGNLDIQASVSFGKLAPDGPINNPLKFATNQAGTPWDTFVMLALWVYCGTRVLMGNGDNVFDETAKSRLSPGD
jgi:arabinofuranan 3-O-arabinosyltransferase